VEEIAKTRITVQMPERGQDGQINKKHMAFQVGFLQARERLLRIAQCRVDKREAIAALGELLFSAPPGKLSLLCICRRGFRAGRERSHCAVT
jgi:hypothetical protein